MKSVCFLLITFFLLSYSSQAQFTKWSFSGGLGLTSYAGDLDITGISNLKPALNFEAWYKLHENIQLKGGTSLYQISADDHVASRNRGFRANHYEIYGAVMIVYPRERVDFFTYIGGGITKVDPEGKRPGWYVDLPEHEIEAQNIEKTALIMPFGLGIRYMVTPTFAVVLDGGYRLTNTDYLDGVSRRQIPVNELGDAAINYHNAIRTDDNRIINPGDNTTIAGGNPDMNDLYGMFTIKFQYILPTRRSSLNRSLPSIR